MMEPIFLRGRFFAAAAGLAFLFACAYAWPPLLPLGQVGLGGLVLLTLADTWLLWRAGKGLSAERHLPRLLSLADENTVRVQVRYAGPWPLGISLVEELPDQFQRRDFAQAFRIRPREERELRYTLRPTERGEYQFHRLLLFAHSPLGLAERRIVAEAGQMVPVYPSILQMKQFELLALRKLSLEQGGIKRLRRIGHSYEFEQIKEYVRGDDYRSINWKASGRSGRLMVNQYEDERAQQVYCLLDKGRAMSLAFEGLSLLDYAINATLALSNIVLRKNDKAGLLSFSDAIGHSIAADKRPRQINAILEALYREQARPGESNYELLYRAVRHVIRGRSLLFLFANFESHYALDRALPLLRKLARLHVLVLVFFENSEIRQFAEQPATDSRGVYERGVAQRFLMEKKEMVQRLQPHGIQAILTRPEDLTMNSINKYLELKARGLI